MPDSSGFTLNSITVTTSGKHEWEIKATGSSESGTFGDVTLSHSGKVRWEGTTASEIVLVANVSGTMCTKDSSRAGDDIYKFELVENCSNHATQSKLNAMKKGFQTVLDKGIEVVNLPNRISGSEFAYRVGVVPFNHKVKLPALTETRKLPNARRIGFVPHKPLEDQYTDAQLTEQYMFTDGWSAVGSGVKLPNTRIIPTPLRANEANLVIKDITNKIVKPADGNFYNNFNDVSPLPMVYPLVDIVNPQSKVALDTYIDSFYQDYQGLGWNRTNIGLLTAGLMLDPTYNSSFGGIKPANFKDPSTEKIVILMTDGANIGCCFASFPEETFKYQYLEEYAVDSAHMVGIQAWKNMGGTWKDNWKTKYGVPDKGVCETLKENDVKVYTIGFGIPKSDSVRGKAREVLQACSSGDQFFFDLDENDQKGMEDAYRTIAQSLVKLRLVE
jgi:hypothetical protein